MKNTIYVIYFVFGIIGCVKNIDKDYPKVIIEKKLKTQFDEVKWELYKLNWARDTLIYYINIVDNLKQVDSIELIKCPLNLVNIEEKNDTISMSMLFENEGKHYWIKPSKVLHFHTITYVNHKIERLEFSDGLASKPNIYLTKKLENDFVNYIYERREVIDIWLYRELKVRYDGVLNF
jgi:hypothetical protein